MRQSNVELLRIVAMLLVFVRHVGYTCFGIPGVVDVELSPAGTFGRIVFQQYSMPCVDVFVMISGYFLIKPKLRGVVGLWFLLAFWAAFSIFTGYAPNGTAWYLHLIFPLVGWFIPAYMGLYLVSPLLNAFTEHSSRREFTMYLICFFALQFVFDLVYPCWQIRGRTIFNHGYSVISMGGFYLLGRYISLYGESLWKRFSPSVWTGLFLALFTGFAVAQYLVLQSAAGGVLSVGIAKRIIDFGTRNTNPVAIAGSCCLMFAFLRMEFSSRIVNWVAMSMLGVYCFHRHPLFKQTAQKIYDSHSGLSVIALLGALVIVFFAVGVVIDQMRLLLWRFACRRRGVKASRRND